MLVTASKYNPSIVCCDKKVDSYSTQCCVLCRKADLRKPIYISTQRLPVGKRANFDSVVFVASTPIRVLRMCMVAP